MSDTKFDSKQITGEFNDAARGQVKAPGRAKPALAFRPPVPAPVPSGPAPSPGGAVSKPTEPVLTPLEQVRRHRELRLTQEFNQAKDPGRGR